MVISIHALVKRATQTLPDPEQIKIDFNPRPREEGDLRFGLGFTYTDISIHALVKRAT